MLVEMKIKGLGVDPSSNTPVVLLTDTTEKFIVPIWIGFLEASAIAVKLEQHEVERPLTHDLMVNVLGSLGASVERIVVRELKDNTFFADLHVRVGEKEMVIDARPSDSLALALRSNASIWMEHAVIEEAAVEEPHGEGEGEEEEKAKDLKEMSLADFPTKYKM